MTEPTTGGLGGLGGYVSSPGFGNILQAVGMSMMSSPRSNPLQNMGKFYTGLQDQQYKEDEQDQQRGAIAAVLKSAGFSDDEAMQLSFNPQAAKLAIEQRQAQQQREADASFMSGMPSFGGIGGAPDATQPGAGDVSALPAVSDASGSQIERTPLPAPTQTLFGLPGAAQADYSHFRTDAAPPSDNYLEPVESIPQQPVQPKPSGNRTMDWLKENDPEAHALVSEENGITPRDAYEISVIRKQAQKQADERQSQLDQLYKYRDQYAQWAASAPNDKTYNKAKRGLDNIDYQISKLEKQQTRVAPPDSVRALEMRAEQAGLQPGSPEYQSFMLAGGNGPLVNIQNSPEGGMFAGMPKDVREEMFKRQGEAQDAADLIGVTNQGLQLLDQGAITGAGSGTKIATIKWAQALGVPVDDDIASAANNTETYRSIMAKAVGKVIKNFGSGTGLSDADRQYAERLAGGDTTLNEPAIRRILAAGVKSAKSKISNFNTMRDKVLGGDLSAMLNVQEPEDYRQPAAPSGAAPRARNPNTGETLEWDGIQWRPAQ